MCVTDCGSQLHVLHCIDIPMYLLTHLLNMQISVVECRDHMFFHALTFAGSRESCLNTRLLGCVFKLRLRDPANVNAKKQTCVTVIRANFT